MPLEPIAPLWPFAATLAVVAGAGVREARRRSALNRALHELRRPLHALVLSEEFSARNAGRDHLAQALVALGDLDGTVNGERPALELRPVVCRALVSHAVERWRAGAVSVMADPVRVAQALDNLLANAIEHGGLRITVDVSLCTRGVRIAVADGGGAGESRRRDPRRGHGLAIVRDIARAHGGRFLLSAGAAGTSAVLELPLAPLPVRRPPLDTAAGPLRRPPLRRRAVGA